MINPENLKKLENTKHLENLKNMKNMKNPKIMEIPKNPENLTNPENLENPKNRTFVAKSAKAGLRGAVSSVLGVLWQLQGLIRPLAAL